MRDHAQTITPGSPEVPRAGWREVVTREHLPRLLVLCLAIWLHAANTLLAATTMPEAVVDIGGLRLISWALALYLMGSIVAATAVSAYVTGHGLRRTMTVSTLIYTMGCIICAAAPTMPVLLAGRTVQGLGGGALVALVFIAQDRFFPNRLVPRIVACLSLVWTASALSGPLIGGAFATAGLRLRVDDAARGVPDSGILAVRRIRAAGIDRKSDRVALQQSDRRRSPPTSTTSSK